MRCTSLSTMLKCYRILMLLEYYRKKVTISYKIVTIFLQHHRQAVGSTKKVEVQYATIKF